MRALLAAVLAAASPHLVVHGDRSFGGVGFGDGRARARAVFGAPDRVVRRGESCFRTWRRYGLLVEFFAFAPEDPCARGGVVSATLSGRAWRTEKGLHVGDAVSSVSAHHPAAAKHADGWWLVTRHACELGGYAPYGSLVAVVRAGKVAALRFQGSICD